MFFGCIVQSGRGREWVDTTAPSATIVVEMEPGHLNSGPAQAISRGLFAGGRMP